MFLPGGFGPCLCLILSIDPRKEKETNGTELPCIVTSWIKILNVGSQRRLCVMAELCTWGGPSAQPAPLGECEQEPGSVQETPSLELTADSCGGDITLRLSVTSCTPTHNQAWSKETMASQPGLQSWLPRALAVRLWESCLTSLCLSFFVTDSRCLFQLSELTQGG